MAMADPGFFIYDQQPFYDLQQQAKAISAAEARKLQEKQAGINSALRKLEEGYGMQHAMQVAEQVPVGKALAIKRAGLGLTMPMVVEMAQALEYLLADVRDNVRRNPSMEALGRNYAMRRADDILAKVRSVI